MDLPLAAGENRRGVGVAEWKRLAVFFVGASEGGEECAENEGGLFHGEKRGKCRRRTVKRI